MVIYFDRHVELNYEALIFIHSLHTFELTNLTHKSDDFCLIIIFSAKCLSSLHTLPASTVDTEYGPLLNCLCAWDRVTEVLQLINEWITSGMSGTVKDTKTVMIITLRILSLGITNYGYGQRIMNLKSQK